MTQKPFKIPTQRKVQARNGVIRLESKKGKATVSVRWAMVTQIPAGRNGKTKLQSARRGKANDCGLDCRIPGHKIAN